MVKSPCGAHPDAPNLDNTDSVYVKQMNTDSVYVIQRISVSDLDNVCICNIDILYALYINSDFKNMEILDIRIYGKR